MRYRKLDENGDYSFGGQQADYYRDTPLAVAQAVNAVDAVPWGVVSGHDGRDAVDDGSSGQEHARDL